MLIVKMLVITLTSFVSEISVSITNALDPRTLCLIIKESFAINSSLFPLLIQASEFEFPVAQVQVTVSPGHTDCLSHVTRAAPAIIVHHDIVENIKVVGK